MDDDAFEGDDALEFCDGRGARYARASYGAGTPSSSLNGRGRDDDDDDDDDDDGTRARERDDDDDDAKDADARVGAVRALSDSDSEEEEEEEDALGGTSAARAWSAYDPSAAAKVSGDGALAVIEEKERVAREAEERAKALLNARGRPKRDAALKTERAKASEGTDVIAATSRKKLSEGEKKVEGLATGSGVRAFVHANQRVGGGESAGVKEDERRKEEARADDEDRGHQGEKVAKDDE